jgi:hypothetical protein
VLIRSWKNKANAKSRREGKYATRVHATAEFRNDGQVALAFIVSRLVFLVHDGDTVMSDPYTERVAVARMRFVANLVSRIGEIETCRNSAEVGFETLAEAHRQSGQGALAQLGYSFGYRSNC